MKFDLKKITIILTLSLATNANAGFLALTWHSRANCLNNESITWEFNKEHDLYTQSYHDVLEEDGQYHLRHITIAELEHTWRSAAVDWGEAINSLYTFQVDGLHNEYHYLPDEQFPIIVTIGNESVRDCSIYDGWWDQDIAKYVKLIGSK
jgi:hypothetical protein